MSIPNLHRTRLFRLALTCCAIGSFIAPADAAEKPAANAKPSDTVNIANDQLRIEMSTAGQRVRTVNIENLRAGRTLALEGDDFIVELSDGKKVRSGALSLTGIDHESAPLGGKKTTFRLEGAGLEIRYVTLLQREQWWANRWLEIRGAPARLTRVHLAAWRCEGASGQRSKGEVVQALGYPSGCGQAVYAQDLFVAIAHPGAENLVSRDGISCSIPAYASVSSEDVVTTEKLVLGAGEAGDAWRAFIGYIDATRPVPAQMLFMVNDWYWKDKSKPLQALESLVEMKQKSGVLVDTFTLDDGWDFDWDMETKIWGRLNRRRFPGGWEALQAVGQKADINISLWFGPIGGYTYRPRRLEFAKQIGFEIQGDKLCLCGPRYKKHVIESFSFWAAQGMDYIKVDGFWPNCQVAEHGHPVGASGAIAQMDHLTDVFAAWRKARPNLLIGYTSGSHPSPFWLQHADYLWRGGRDDSHAGKGTPFDRHNTYLDSILNGHRNTDTPMSAFVTFDIVQDRILQGNEEAYERGFWWLAARTSLHHDWYLQASDLTLERWKKLAEAARWAKQHEKTFRYSRMIGGDPAQGELYGFSAFDGRRGVLALRNPSDEPRGLEGTLTSWLLLPQATQSRTLRVRGVFGETQTLDGTHRATEPLRIELSPLQIAVFEL